MPALPSFAGSTVAASASSVAGSACACSTAAACARRTMTARGTVAASDARKPRRVGMVYRMSRGAELRQTTARRRIAGESLANRSRNEALLHPVANPRPADIGNERQRPVAHLAAAWSAVVAGSGDVRVVHEERTSSDVRLRYDAPVSAVLRAVPVVTHHEEVLGGDEQRPPIVVR